MGGEESWSWQPIASPTSNGERSEVHFSPFDTSVNAVSFGFVATAILISMFLFMAIFERFLQPNFPHFPISANHDIESQPPFNPKLAHSSPKQPGSGRGIDCGLKLNQYLDTGTLAEEPSHIYISDTDKGHRLGTSRHIKTAIVAPFGPRKDDSLFSRSFGTDAWRRNSDLHSSTSSFAVSSGSNPVATS